jgi:hypothetical protein
MDALLVDGAPVPMPVRCDTVFATIDTAIKSGLEHDATAAVFWAYNSIGTPCVHILDWDILQIEGAALEGWLPSVFARLEGLSRECGARRGSIGVMIEDKASGTVLLQQARNGGWPAYPIESKLTSMGKNERAIAASPYVHRGDIKITDSAFHKTKVHKGRSANHLVAQITSFRIGSRDGASDDLLDCFCYGIAMARGTNAGSRRGI